MRLPEDLQSDLIPQIEGSSFKKHHHSLQTLPPLSLTDEDFNFSSDNISTVSSLVTNTLLDSALAPPPGWGDEPEHVDESTLASLPTSQMENDPISVETQVQNNNVCHTGKEKKDQGLTAFCQKTINTPTGKIHKIAMLESD